MTIIEQRQKRDQLNEELRQLNEQIEKEVKICDHSWGNTVCDPDTL